MARFYFHLGTGDDYERDEVGSDHASANDAYLEAFEAAQQMAVDLIREHRSPRRYRFDICDEQGQLLFQVPFTEILGHRTAPHGATQVVRGHSLAAAVRDEIITARSELETLRTLLSKL